MTSFDRKLVAVDQFSFSSNSLSGVESGEDYRLAFGEWTGWHCDNYGTSECHCAPGWLAKDDGKSTVDHPSSSFGQLSPTSRVQAIATYKQEMLELVQDAPEYVYELSLRDLVELPRIARAERESPMRERTQKNKAMIVGEKKVKKIGRHSRSESMEGAGFLLKMFFPIPSLGKKRNSISSNGSLTQTSRSSSSGSSSSSSSSSSCGATESGSGSRVSPKPLKDGRKPGADKNSEVKSVEMQHGALSRNLSRYDEELSKYFHKVSEHISPLFQASDWLLFLLPQPKQKQHQEDLVLRRSLLQPFD